MAKADGDKCQHCGRQIRPHTWAWRSARPGDPARPEENGEEWGDVLLWVGGELAGVMCASCYSKGKKFKPDGT